MRIDLLSSKQINDYIKLLNIEEALEYVPILLQDKRKSMNQLGINLNKKYELYLSEKERVSKIWSYETQLIIKGYKAIAGLDEAGRGPLAGPVVAAAVILPHNLFIQGINDSKKLSKTKREEIYKIILEKALAIGVGIVDHHTIDQTNILKATQQAMKDAINQLSIFPDYLLIDAVKLSDIYVEQRAIIEGDSKSISIAAASIVAKVTRDRIMDELSKIYPLYGFEAHKGYGTREHYENIIKYGISPIHRKSFLKNIMGDIKHEDQSVK